MTNGTSGASVRLSYLKIRDVSTKAEEDNGASTYVAVLPAVEILKIGTDGNLRSYIPAHEGKKRNLVHKAIARTISDKSDRFSQLNSGFLIGASKITVDDNNRIVTLRNASVNNGAQSQGEIRRYMEECEKKGEPPANFAIRCELSIEPDDATRTDIAVARNTATRIEGISIAGKHGYFDALNDSFRTVFPELELARSETNVEEHYVDTRQLLQVLWAMMPQELEPEGRKTIEARMRAYKNAAFCLQDFVEIIDRKDDPGNAARYAYFLDMAGAAWKEYQRWRTHQLWNDKRLYERLGQAVRDDDGQIREISDGIVFPILTALSRFMKRTSLRRKWQLVYPAGWEDEDLLLAARRQLKECDGRPMLMGRSGSAYEALMTVTEMAVRLADRYSQLAASAQQKQAAELAIARLPFDPAFLTRIDDLELSIRTLNCYKNDNVLYVGDAVQKTEAEMLRVPNFGRKSLNEMKEVLAQGGFYLGMEVPGWPPENIEQLAKAYAAVSPAQVRVAWARRKAP